MKSILGLIVLCFLSSSYAKLNQVHIIDTKGLMKNLDQELLKADFSKITCDEEVTYKFQGQYVYLDVKKCTKNKVVIKAIKKDKILAKEYKALGNSMMKYILAKSNTKVEVNGTLYINTYVVSSVKPVIYTLDTGDTINAYQVVLTTPDTQYAGMGIGPSITLKFIVAPQVSPLEQVLFLSINGQELINVRYIK